MLEIYTIYGGGMWKTALDAVVTLVGQNTFHTLMRIASTFGVLAVLFTFIKQRNPMVFVQWLAVFMILTSILLVPKRSVQVIDLSDPAAVWKTDNVPVGLAAIASLTTSIGYKMSSVYDMLMARPDSITYSKTGMLFGSRIVAETSDFTTQNPELAQMLPDYVENCVIGDILLNGKYTINQLLNSTDPLTLITSNPSPLRGIFKMTSTSRQFLTCQQAATEIKTLVNTDVNPGSATFTWLTRKVFGNKLNGAALLSNAMGESYGYFYSGGMTAAQIMKNNITNSAVRQGIKGFAARSSDTANLLNLATENASTKQRLSWAAGNELATRTLPFAQSLLMLILVCLFPLMIALAASNHSIFGLNTLKIYICGFIYFQMWPVMFAILNYAANYWLQSQSGGTPLVLANKDIVALQHSDVANLAGYLSLSIPVLSFYLTKGAAAIGSQVAGSVLSSGAFTSAGVAATTADGNWSFNNMSMDNVSQNKMDTNLVQRQGQQTWQADNGSTQTQTAGGHTVIDGSGAMSNLPVNMKLSQLASSGFQESARQSQVQAQTALDGYNHSVTSGWSQLSQLSHQTGSSDSLIRGSENSQATNATRGASMMMSAAESYAKANNISAQEAYNQLMSKSVEGSVSAGASGKFNTGDQAFGKVGKWATGVSFEAHAGAEVKGSSGSSHGTQETHSSNQDMRHDQNSQAVNDFRQGMDMVKSSRITDGANHTENAASSNVQQLATTLNDAESQYHQYTTSSTQSNEFSRMATVAQNQSASLDTNYTQEFVDWAANKYGDKAQSMLTSAPSAREAAMEFVNERLKPEIMGDYLQGRSDLASGNEHAAFSGEHVVQPAHGSHQGSGPAGNDGGMRYSPVESGSYNSNSTDNYRTDGMSQVTEHAGNYGGQDSSGGENVSVRTGGSASGSHEPSLLAQNQTENQDLAGQRGISHNELRSDYGGQEQRSEIQTGTHKSEQGSLSISASNTDTARHSAERQHSDTSAGMQQELRQSGTLREPGGAAGHGNEMRHSHTTINVEEQRVQGNAMQTSFKENQAKLHEQSGQGFGPQNDIQRRVAEQRSENEHKINESSGEIVKKQSTVQASSDILKGENENIKSQFHEGKQIEDLKQKTLPILHEDEIERHKQNIKDLRRRVG
ncbi:MULTISPECIES: conjugal transfer mating-pair stabilization protein TraG [Enterobacter cloacae complex]|uniref:conjugal transfer mating-pair stabilization protein TraG n=1 Tax=Enterobacter cloacae complex TaxID=354276 RepID=UPI000DCE4B7A|nr:MULTISPECIES: conjugal transfer mating-pair stabilization protein TraG [Enterobacter cloacae complex]RAY76654.1 conjugal transfer protein TraG [Enterobacter kobei]